MTAKDLKAKQLKAVADARAISEAAGDKGMTAEDLAKFDAFMAEADGYDEQIKRALALDERERKAQDTQVDPVEAASRNRAPVVVAEPIGMAELPSPDSYEARRAIAVKTPEYRNVFAKALRFGTDALQRDEKRALSVGSDTAGGYLVPDEFSRQLVQDLNAPTVVRQRATVLSGVGGDRQIPFVSAHGEATWTAEGVAHTQSDETFGLKIIGAHKLSRLIKVSVELMQDSVFDLESYLSREFARSFNAAEDTAFVKGTGVSEPRGFTLDGTAGVTATGTTSITADELIDLYHTMPIPHRPQAVFVLADATLKSVRKLKTGDGQYLWVPGLQAGQTDTLLGRPVVVSDDMPAMTTGLKAVWFIDLSYYYIVDRAGMYVQLLRELYAANGQVGFLGYRRTDGRLILDTPARYITMA